MAAPLGDNYPNLLRYHLGLSPRESSSGVFEQELADNGSRLVLRYWRALHAQDAIAQVKWSGDLTI